MSTLAGDGLITFYPPSLHHLFVREHYQMNNSSIETDIKNWWTFCYCSSSLNDALTSYNLSTRRRYCVAFHFGPPNYAWNCFVFLLFMQKSTKTIFDENFLIVYKCSLIMFQLWIWLWLFCTVHWFDCSQEKQTSAPLTTTMTSLSGQVMYWFSLIDLLCIPFSGKNNEIYEWKDDFTPATYFSRDKTEIRANHNFILLMVYSAVE